MNSTTAPGGVFTSDAVALIRPDHVGFGSQSGVPTYMSNYPSCSAADQFILDKVGKAGQAVNGIRLPVLTLLWNVEQRTLVIGECCRVEDLDAGAVVAGKRRCGIRTPCLRGILRRIEPNPEVINLHGTISYRARR